MPLYYVMNRYSLPDWKNLWLSTQNLTQCYEAYIYLKWTAKQLGTGDSGVEKTFNTFQGFVNHTATLFPAVPVFKSMVEVEWIKRSKKRSLHSIDSLFYNYSIQSINANNYLTRSEVTKEHD